jgi:hypothetical protein
MLYVINVVRGATSDESTQHKHRVKKTTGTILGSVIVELPNGTLGTDQCLWTCEITSGLLLTLLLVGKRINNNNNNNNNNSIDSNITSTNISRIFQLEFI